MLLSNSTDDTNAKKNLLEGAINTNTNIHGYFLHSGASRPVLCEEQFYAYNKHVKTTIKIRESPYTFRFGNGNNRTES